MNNQKRSNVFKSLIPIISNSDIPEQIATGVLLQIKEILFILTAGHVIDQLENKGLLVPCIEGLIPFDGTICYMPLNSEKERESDTIDFAYLKIDSQWNFSIREEFEPLTVYDLNLTDYVETNDRYAFAGFPYRKSKFLKNCINPEVNVAIRFDRKKAQHNTKQQRGAPLPHGISGGGIFAYPKDISSEPNPRRMKLVGIAHTYYEQRKIMYGTSINFCISIIIQNNKELFKDINDLEQLYRNTELPLVLGFAYYKKEQWNQIRSIMNDGDTMKPIWEDWRLTLENAIDRHFSEGRQVLRVVLDINEILEYCAERDLPLNAKSRVELVNVKLAKMFFEETISFC